MKKVDYKSLSLDELNAKLQTEKENLRRLSFSHAISPLENPASIRFTKKEIARINTELRAKQQ